MRPWISSSRLTRAASLIVAQDLGLTRYVFRSSLIPSLVIDQMSRTGSRAAARKRARVCDTVIELYGEDPSQAEWIGILLS